MENQGVIAPMMEETDRHWADMGIIVREFAKEHGREFNQMYERKKKQDER